MLAEAESERKKKATLPLLAAVPESPKSFMGTANRTEKGAKETGDSSSTAVAAAAAASSSFLSSFES